jgi:hypothetical protein
VRNVGGAHFVNGDQINQSGAHAIGKIEGGSRSTAERRGDPHRHTVLLLMSNPADTQRLRLDEEYRAIDQAIVAARFRDQLDLRAGMAPRHHDLHELLLRHRPAVVHYAGHSSADGIALVDDHGRARPVSPAALEGLFAIVGDAIQCVVLNGCLTEDQASAIARHVPCVVGMSGSVLDGVAVEFAGGFYGAIANGESVEQAFRLGRNVVELRGMDARDPTLIGAPAARRLFITG